MSRILLGTGLPFKAIHKRMGEVIDFNRELLPAEMLRAITFDRETGKPGVVLERMLTIIENEILRVHQYSLAPR